MNSVAVTTQNGVTSARQYYAYGSKRGGADYTFEPNYTGQRLDGTGLLYYNARYYDPEQGLFISPDSLIPDPEEYFSYNRYLYADGDPLSNNDPTGHCAVSVVAPSPGATAFDTACAIIVEIVGGSAAAGALGLGLLMGGMIAGIPLTTDELPNYPPPITGQGEGQLIESFPVPGSTTLTIEGVPLIQGDPAGIQGIEPDDLSSSIITTYRGGSYGALPTGGLVRHHMPANWSNPWTRYSGPAIQMDPNDHYLTRSYGSGPDAVAYRELLKALIEAGRIEDAMQMEIFDIQNKFGDKYDDAIREMLDYAVERGFIPSE